MINWDMIDGLLRQSRPNHTGPFRVAIYSRMPYDDGQEATAEIHIKFMKLVLDRDPRFRVEGVYSEFGVPFTDLDAMQEYQLIIEKCKAGEVDLVMIHDLSRLSKDCIHLMINAEPLAHCQPEIGILSFRDQLLVIASDAAGWAEKMASGDYSACRLPYYVGFTPLPPGHCEI